MDLHQVDVVGLQSPQFALHRRLPPSAARKAFGYYYVTLRRPGPLNGGYYILLRHAPISKPLGVFAGPIGGLWGVLGSHSNALRRRWL
eukprot:9503778-Pyramimonas_sp.AAC.2